MAHQDSYAETEQDCYCGEWVGGRLPHPLLAKPDTTWRTAEESRALISLPDASKLPAAPSHSSHWVLAGKLIAGAHPLGRGSKADVEQELGQLVSAGATLTVNLSGFSQPFFEDFSHYELHPSLQHHFEHEIEDGYVPLSFDELKLLLEKLVVLLDHGHCLFLHCFGGHGRTGFVTVALLCAALKVPVAAGLAFFLETHRARRHCSYGCYILRYNDLETSIQMDTLRRWEPRLLALEF